MPPTDCTADWRRDLFEVGIKLKNLIVEIGNSMTKLKLQENLGLILNFQSIYWKLMNLVKLLCTIEYFIFKHDKIQGVGLRN